MQIYRAKHSSCIIPHEIDSVQRFCRHTHETTLQHLGYFNFIEDYLTGYTAHRIVPQTKSPITTQEDVFAIECRFQLLKNPSVLNVRFASLLSATGKLSFSRPLSKQRMAQIIFSAILCLALPNTAHLIDFVKVPLLTAPYAYPENL